MYEAFVVLLGGMVAAALFLMALAKMAQGWRDRADTSHAERTRPTSATASRRESERDRIRKKYFEKERRQRQARQREARFQQQHAPPREEARRSSERARPEPAARTESEHLVVLGLQPGFSQDELRRAYRARVAEYHPDRVASLGPKLKRLAEEETKRITAAYAFLKRDG